ncbi:Hypothetical protein, putative [Bodo saltans]|uniref:CRAL-TRIO domain-containing protein n=1 Tax=Bodo saltans TaxID=75058 RepID=A0A0S4IP40_BODSA|nr:Hypothetical protein, putative [Bodo saltans]|eukprot:CUE72557.1 Hypothetical protein, putative [Bodo saltans]
MATYFKPASEKEQKIVDSIRTQLNGVKLAEDDTSFLINDALILRYLRHKDGKEEKALKSILECVEWRKTTKPYLITFDSVKEWAGEGANYCAGFTKIGIPIIQLRLVSSRISSPLTASRNGLGRERTIAQASLRSGFPSSNSALVSKDVVNVTMRVNYVIWALEELMRRGYYESVFIGDFSAFEKSPTDDEKKVREGIDDVRSRYYPLFETQTYFVSMPLFLRAIFAVMQAFMSGAQKEVMHTGLKPKHLLEWIDASQLPERLGGTLPVLKKTEGGAEVVDVLAMFPAQRKA